MAKEQGWPHFSEKIRAYAEGIADQQVTQAELDMQRSPDTYLEYTRAAIWLDDEERDLIQKLGDDAMDTEDILNAAGAKAAALAIEVYKRGVLDGGRIYHAFVTRELP